MNFKPRLCYLALVPKPSIRTLDRGFRGLYSVVILLILHMYKYILHVTVARSSINLYINLYIYIYIYIYIYKNNISHLYISVDGF